MLALFLSMMLIGCAPREPQPPLHVFVGLDRSGSALPHLETFLRTVVEVGERLSPERDRLTCYRLDDGVREWYDGPAPADPEGFQLVAVQAVEREARQRGTRPGLFFQEVARRLAQEPADARVVVLCLWDGGDDDQSAAHQADARRALRALAADPRVVRVALVGLGDDTRIGLRERFADFGPRLALGDVELGPLLAEARQ